MGADYYAKTILGARVAPAEKLYREAVVKIGEHDYPEDVIYHPKTGKKLWSAEAKPLYGLDAEEHIHCAGDEGSREDFAIVGRALCKGGYYGGAGLVNLDELNAVAAELRPWLKQTLGDLFDPAAFGVWSLLYVNY